MVELFAARFRQEDGFRDLKQRLGGEECRAWTANPIERRPWHERGVRGSSAGIARCSRSRRSSEKRSVARWGHRGDSGGTHQAAIVHFFRETTV